MKQVLQNRKTGEIEVADVPAPSLQRGRVLVRTAASLISAGTERAAVEQNRKGLLGRAIEQPELVKRTVQRALNEGVSSAVNAVRAKLESAVALGYSAAGTVIATGEGITEISAGDRVACAGLGFASHAEVLSVPKNLCALLSRNVSFADGAFATLGAIALQGVRLAQPTLGESVVVVGMGLIGQLTSQLLRASGCRVYAVDTDSRRVDLGVALGADSGSIPDENTAARIVEWTRGRGADVVIITASSSSNTPLVLAAEASRLKGRVVVVGQVGMEIPRDLFYRRELSVQVSMSYGPGRYDPAYEERGQDYPLPYVRWTEGRNLEAFIDMVERGLVNVQKLNTHRFSIDEAPQAYALITGENSEPHLGVLLEYGRVGENEKAVHDAQKLEAAPARARATKKSEVRLGLIGAGAYASGVLLPHFKNAGVAFESVASASGVSSLNVARNFGFTTCASGADEVFNNRKVNLLVIATRHDMHAQLAARALDEGLDVFVEKPLAITEEELESLIQTAEKSSGRLMVGFNRRFSPLAVKAREFFSDRRWPLSFVYRVNAGRLPRDHWVYDEREGGGRIVGEVCHFVDLLSFWAGSPVVRVYAQSVSTDNNQIVPADSVIITLRFADGSNGNIAYLAEGDRTMPKERVEIFGGGRTFVLDDYRSASIFSQGREEKLKLRAQDKGQADEVRAVCEVVMSEKPAPISIAELRNTSLATFRINESLRTGNTVDV